MWQNLISLFAILWLLRLLYHNSSKRYESEKRSFICQSTAFVSIYRFYIRILVANSGTVTPTPPQGRDKSGPYGGGVASLAIEEHFATSILPGDS